MPDNKSCLFPNCKSNTDFREAFDVSEDGNSLTIYELEVDKHNHAIPVIYKGRDFKIGRKGNVTQIWEETTG